MTKIKYTNTKEFFCIEFKGHAGYAKIGKDIVCSSLSTLANVLYVAALQSEKDGEITDLKVDGERGYFKMSYVYVKDSGMRSVVNAVIDTLKKFEPEYGDYFKVCEVEDEI